MLTWAIIFAVCALIFGLLGFTGLARGFATIARFLLALFLILLVLAPHLRLWLPDHHPLSAPKLPRSVADLPQPNCASLHVIYSSE